MKQKGLEQKLFGGKKHKLQVVIDENLARALSFINNPISL